MKFGFLAHLVCACKFLRLFPLVFALQSVFGIAMAGQDLNSLFADKLPPGTTPLAATWIQGNIFLPASALKNGSRDHLNVFPKSDDWAQKVKDEHLKDGVRLPAVIFLHGCTGFHTGRRFVKYFLDEGFAAFAPNSFGRPGRVVWCGQPGMNSGVQGGMDSRVFVRKKELKYALSKVREIEWVDSSRLVLAGFSEGGQTVADWSGKEFIAHVLFGTDCRFADGSSNAPTSIPVLNVVGSDDEWGYGTGCFISDKRSKGSKRVIVPGGNHSMTNSEIPRLAIAEFLKTCCAQ